MKYYTTVLIHCSVIYLQHLYSHIIHYHLSTVFTSSLFTCKWQYKPHQNNSYTVLLALILNIEHNCLALLHLNSLAGQQRAICSEQTKRRGESAGSRSEGEKLIQRQTVGERVHTYPTPPPLSLPFHHFSVLISVIYSKTNSCHSQTRAQKGREIQNNAVNLRYWANSCFDVYG